ncbi:MAG: hydrogenase maturation protease [Thermoanaerobaculales bacterium]
MLGLGNPVLGDDAVGLHVAAEVERLLLASPLPGVRVLSSARGGFELIDLLAGSTHAVIVDCLEVPGGKPGTVRRLSLKSFAGSARLVGAHEMSVADAFELARTLGIAMPDTVEILAVEGGEMRTLGEGMTPPVSATVKPLARRVLRRVARWLRQPSRASRQATVRAQAAVRSGPQPKARLCHRILRHRGRVLV